MNLPNNTQITKKSVKVYDSSLFTQSQRSLLASKQTKTKLYINEIVGLVQVSFSCFSFHEFFFTVGVIPKPPNVLFRLVRFHTGLGNVRGMTKTCVLLMVVSKFRFVCRDY